MNQVPIRAHVKGAAIFQATGLNHTFEHTYDFVDFDTNVPSSAFLVSIHDWSHVMTISAFCIYMRTQKPISTVTAQLISAVFRYIDTGGAIHLLPQSNISSF